MTLTDQGYEAHQVESPRQCDDSSPGIDGEVLVVLGNC